MYAWQWWIAGKFKSKLKVFFTIHLMPKIKQMRSTE